MIILYVIITAIIVLLLILSHNWALGKGESNPFKHSAIELTLTEQVVVYSIVSVVPILLMFWLASPPLISGLFATGVTILSSLLIIPSLKSLLEKMRETPLSWDFLINQNVWLIISFLLLTELGAVNWMAKEKMVYFFSGPFLYFTFAYLGLLTLVGIFLAIPKQGGYRKFPKDWRFRTLIVLDPVIILSVAWFFIQVVANVVLPWIF